VAFIHLSVYPVAATVRGLVDDRCRLTQKKNLYCLHRYESKKSLFSVVKPANLKKFSYTFSLTPLFTVASANLQVLYLIKCLYSKTPMSVGNKSSGADFIVEGLSQLFNHRIVSTNLQKSQISTLVIPVIFVKPSSTSLRLYESFLCLILSENDSF
jgi:hypothetical protein